MVNVKPNMISSLIEKTSVKVPGVYPDKWNTVKTAGTKLPINPKKRMLFLGTIKEIKPKANGIISNSKT